MNPDEAYKNKILGKLASIIADGLEKGQLTKEEASQSSSYILENIDKAKNNSELFGFLEEVAVKWPMFSSLVAAEQSDVVESVKQEKVGEINGLIKENKIDEALKVATDANASDTDTGGGN